MVPMGEKADLFHSRASSEEEKSGGTINTELYPSAQLGKIPRLIKGLQLGTVEFLGTPSGFLKSIDPRYQILEVPGVFGSPLHARKTITGPAFREPFLNIGVSGAVEGASRMVRLRTRP